ncbi:hypothetical protein L204_103706 [Cryptococcus depauperatus]|nr:cyclin C [Cryptococcus depauperatus CBS 7855]
MSSNFYASSHNRYWLLTRSAIYESRKTDLKYCSPRQLYCLFIFFCQLIQKLGKRLLLRQIPIATACVFMKRFYFKNSVCETNPYLVLAACVYAAAKVEETPVHIKSVVSEAKLVFSEHNIRIFPAEANKIGEMEFYLLEDLDFHLIVFHPYRALLHLTGREPADFGTFDKSRMEEDFEIRKAEADMKRSRDEEARKGGARGQNVHNDCDVYGENEEERIRRLMGRGTGEGIMEIDEGVLQISWFILNDSYRTDAPLLYPPYVIALSAIYIAFCLTSMSNSSARTRTSSSQLHTLATSISINEQLHLSSPPAGAAEFLAGFQISLPILFGCVQEIIGLYPLWEAFEPTTTRNQTSGQHKGLSPVMPPTSLGLKTRQAATQNKEEKFGTEEAEVLVRRMIDARMTDLGHPDMTNTNKSSTTSTLTTTGKKRNR